MTDNTKRLRIIADVLGHHFSQPELLLQACTHSSYGDSNASANERRNSNNERMEFLGDAVLGAAISDVLYHRHTSADEGALSRSRSQLVSRFMLARAIEATDILDVCLFGAHNDEGLPDSVKANIAEGILGAIYIDAGWDVLYTAVERLLSPFYDQANAMNELTDARNALQTWALKHHKCLPLYATQRQGGSDHQPQFQCTITIGEHRYEAIGMSKRKSESLAAHELLKVITHSESV